MSIYTRSLAPSEIAAIYAAGSAGKCHMPYFTRQPASQIGYWSGSVTFSATVVGASPLTYQWRKDGVPITGAVTNSLVLTNLQGTDAAAYTLLVTNVYGSATSAPAYLTVNSAGVSIALYSGLTIAGVAGSTYGIQYTTDPSSTNSWLGLTNVTLGASSQVWYEATPASQSRRFYRVVPGPIPIP